MLRPFAAQHISGRGVYSLCFNAITWQVFRAERRRRPMLRRCEAPFASMMSIGRTALGTLQLLLLPFHNTRSFRGHTCERGQYTCGRGVGELECSAISGNALLLIKQLLSDMDF